MAKYIDKDALVAEIDDWRDKIKKGIFIIPLEGRQRADAAFEYEILGRVRDFFDTLEVKEVKKDVWKDNSELPQENVPIIACCIGDTLVIQGMFKIINKGYKSETYRISSYGWDVVKKWAYMEELFPYRSHEIPIYFENELVEGDKHYNRELESHKAWEESLLYADRIRGSF